jgi:inner membrane protein
MTNEKQNPSFFQRNAAIVKGLIIGTLILLLLIPTSFINSLINERQFRKISAIEEISSKWGKDQQFLGPILKVPYFKYLKKEKLNAKGKKEIEQTRLIEYAYFFPDNLSISGEILPEKRSRGIYDVIVYRSKLNFSGNFKTLAFDKLDILEENIIWNNANVLLSISDFRGIDNEVGLSWNNKTSNFSAGAQLNVDNQNGAQNYACINTPVGIENGGKKENVFSFSINLKGSESLYFIPTGKTTMLNLHSTWANPSFEGAFLPDKRKVSKDGFAANWKILHLNRDFPQQWSDTAPSSLRDSSFGVKLITPNDDYQKTSRSSKYAILIISLTFLGFFFIEIFIRKKLHPFNYILIGLALCIYYTLLISISEFFNFNSSYFIATILTLGLIFLYSKSIFGQNKSAYIITILMLILYGFIFVIIQLEDTALLIGSIGLFIILALTMFVSRKIDWQKIGLEN